MIFFTRYFQVGRSFFSEPRDPMSLGEGCEIWYGAYKSIRPTQSGMMINIDYASTAFYKTQSVMDFLIETSRLRDYPRTMSDSERLRFQKSIKGKKSSTLKKFVYFGFQLIIFSRSMPVGKNWRI